MAVVEQLTSTGSSAGITSYDSSAEIDISVLDPAMAPTLSVLIEFSLSLACFHFLDTLPSLILRHPMQWGWSYSQYVVPADVGVIHTDLQMQQHNC